LNNVEDASEVPRNVWAVVGTNVFDDGAGLFVTTEKRKEINCQGKLQYP